MPPTSAAIAATSTDQRGESPWVVIAPGFAVDRYFLRPAGALARRGVDVSVVPAPGSARPGGHPDPRTAGAAIAAYVRRAAGGRRPLLAGHSAGAQAALHAAAELGDAVRAVLLVGPTTAPAHRRGPGLLASWAADLAFERPTLLASQIPDWVRAGPAQLARTLRATLADTPEEAALALAAPLVVARGSRDLICPSGWALQLAAAAPQGRVLTVPRAPHSWPWSRPEQFADVAEELLDGTDGRPRRFLTGGAG